MKRWRFKGGSWVVVKMRRQHHLWHTSLSSQWGSSSEALGILFHRRVLLFYSSLLKSNVFPTFFNSAHIRRRFWDTWCLATRYSTSTLVPSDSNTVHSDPQVSQWSRITCSVHFDRLMLLFLSTFDQTGLVANTLVIASHKISSPCWYSSVQFLAFLLWFLGLSGGFSDGDSINY